jgi:hypothetical protein
LSSNSCWTLTCLIGGLIRWPASLEQREEVGGARRVRELVAEGALGEHLRELGQELQVEVGGLLRHEEHEHLRHGLPSGASNATGWRSRTNAPARLLESLDAAVRNRDALAEARGPELLACGEARRDRTRVEAACAANAAPTASNRRALVVASRSSRMLSGESSSAIWFIRDRVDSAA